MLRQCVQLTSMHLKKRSALILLVLCTFLISFSFWSRCVLPGDTGRDVAVVEKREPLAVADDFEDNVRFVNRNAKNYNMPVNEMDMPGTILHEIECDINKEYSVQCRKDGNEVYMPFSFIQKYFEVYGQIEGEGDSERFEFSHSYSAIHQPPDKIEPDGKFFSFEHYNVEIRKRVKCITAIEGVPMSTQWEANGHYYPIQIAQFALSHYSKYLQAGEPDRTVLLRGTDDDLDTWSKDGKTLVRSMWDRNRLSDVIEFQGSDSFTNLGIYIQLREETNFAVVMDIKFITNGSVSVTLKSEETTFHLHYVFSNKLISCKGKDIFYGLGDNRIGKWIHFSRDIDADLLKGLSLKCSKHRKTKELTITQINIRGHGWVDNATVQSAAHMDHFYNGAKWFVNHQDSRGGWPIMVTRTLLPGVMELPPGWYSAMAQGHGISTLVRAYLKSRDEAYLSAAIRALDLFEINSAQGGVKARFANTYDWYEEYPTTPSSFVLNGFIYSLFGLYDLKQIVKDEPLKKVTRLYNEGMKSLKAMLLLYDSGFGTFYDLRHVSVGIAPNRARWDYHTTHISQLLQLAKMDGDELFLNTARRWSDYMNGKRSPHN